MSRDIGNNETESENLRQIRELKNQVEAVQAESLAARELANELQESYLQSKISLLMVNKRLQYIESVSAHALTERQKHIDIMQGEIKKLMDENARLKNKAGESIPCL